MVFDLLRFSAENSFLQTTRERLMNMSIAPMVHSNANQSVINFQAQQQKVQQQFQSIAQEFQSGDLSSAQSSTLSEETLPATAQSNPSQPGVQNNGTDSNLRRQHSRGLGF